MALRLKSEKQTPEKEKSSTAGKDQVELLKSKPPSLIEIIDESILYMQEEVGFLRPSSLWGCERMCVFQLAMAPKSPEHKDPRMMKILKNGDKVHEILQKYIGDHPEYWFAPESRVDATISVAGCRVKGSCDGIVIRRSDGYRFAIEVKSKASGLFQKLVKPDPAHILQASVYAKLHKVWWTTIIYWDKDTQYLKEFPVCFCPDRWAKIEERVATIKGMADAALTGKGENGGRLWDSLETKKLPVFNPKRCDPGFCPFTTFCKIHGGRPQDVQPPPWFR